METQVELNLDLGNSETRVQFIHGGKRYAFTMANRFGEVSPTAKLNKRYQNDLTTILRADGVIYANGRIVEQEFNDMHIRPDSLQSKVNQDVTYITVRLAIAKVHIFLSRITGFPIEDLKLTFNVNVLLPPINVNSQSKEFADKIQQITHVEILSPVFATPRFVIKEVTVHPEGVAAFTGVFYKEINQQYFDNSDADTLGYEVYDNSPTLELVEVDENKDFTDGYTLVFDIGAGTTDVSLFRNFELVDRSKDTFNIGGNLVHSSLDNIFREELSFKAESDNILQAILTGLLVEGSKTHIVDEQVLRSKRAYSDRLIPEVRQYLERLGIDIKSIKGILAIGGGSVATVRDGVEVVPPMNHLLLEYLKNLAPNIKKLHTTGSLRNLNIDGLYIIAKYSN